MSYPVMSLAQRQNLAANLRTTMATRGDGTNSFKRQLVSGEYLLKKALRPEVSWAPSAQIMSRLATYCGTTVETLVSQDLSESIVVPRRTVAAAASESIVVPRLVRPLILPIEQAAAPVATATPTATQKPTVKKPAVKTIQDLGRELAAMPVIDLKIGREENALTLKVEHGRMDVTAPGGLHLNANVELLEDGTTFRSGNIEVTIKYVAQK